MYADKDFRDQITHALATHAAIGPGVMVLYDVTTLYFETDGPDPFMVVVYLSSQPNRAGYQVSTKKGAGPSVSKYKVVTS